MKEKGKLKEKGREREKRREKEKRRERGKQKEREKQRGAEKQRGREKRRERERGTELGQLQGQVKGCCLVLERYCHMYHMGPSLLSRLGQRHWLLLQLRQ